MRTLLARNFALIGRAFSASLVIFFAFGFLISAFDLDFGQTFMGLIRWGDGDARHYELMIEVIYLVWGAYLWVAVGDPSRHWLLLDFTLVANVAHFSLMAVLAMLDHHEHQHLAGDVLLGMLGLMTFAPAWLAVRSQARSALPSAGR